MNTIARWAEIPEFEDEAAEARFWENHELDGLRFDPRMLSRIKRIARTRFLNYQSMMKQWLAERLEEEMRKQ
ncbi:MAG: BrnA antitoxin family protein [Akkermansiaceae bacterium]|nr:BrnA antitoxin family protein [Akkermansiaceae bacterium]